jgi:hypothetical protein
MDVDLQQIGRPHTGGLFFFFYNFSASLLADMFNPDYAPEKLLRLKISAQLAG